MVYVFLHTLLMSRVYNAHLLNFKNRADMEYYSQHGQDKFLNEEIFQDKENGVFVDIGAHDGVSISNSYFFEKMKNWTGVCIEPIPSVFDKLKNSRKCHMVNCAISDKEGTADFICGTGYVEMLSGLKENYDERHLARANKEIEEYGGKIETVQV